MTTQQDSPKSDNKMTPLQSLAFATGFILGWPILIAINILVWKLALSL